MMGRRWRLRLMSMFQRFRGRDMRWCSWLELRGCISWMEKGAGNVRVECIGKIV